MNTRLNDVGSGHVEWVVYPQSINASPITGDAIRLDINERVDFLFQFGAIHDSADADLTFVGTTDGAAGTATTLATINYRTKVTTGAWSDWSQVTDSKLDLVSGGEIGVTDNILVQVSIGAEDLRDLGATLRYIHPVMGAPGQAVLYSVVAVVSGERYSTEPPMSAL